MDDRFQDEPPRRPRPERERPERDRQEDRDEDYPARRARDDREDYDDDGEDFDDRDERPRRKAVSSDDRTMGMFAHLGGILAGFLVPLIIWQMKKDQSRFVERQAIEALNFQLNLMIHGLLLGVITVATCGIGLVLMLPWAVYALVMPILAGMKANQGEYYQYPATIRMIK